MKLKIALFIITIFIIIVYGYQKLNKDIEDKNNSITRLSEGPLSVDGLSELANFNIQPKPILYYSTYQPDDELYEPVLAIQQKRAYDSVEKLEELVEKGNADAMYWLGFITYSSNAFSGREGAELFKKSAELGNPYAALMLDDDNNDCKERMPQYCDKKWGELAKELLKQKAELGDLRAGLTLIPYNVYKTIPEQQELERIAIIGYKNGYFDPIVRLLNEYMSFSDFEHETLDFSLNEKEIELIKTLYINIGKSYHRQTVSKIMINNDELFTGEQVRKIEKINRNVIGYSYRLFLFSAAKNVRNQKREDFISLIAHSEIAENIMPRHDTPVILENKKESLSNEETEYLKKLIIDSEKEITQIIQIDMRCPSGWRNCLELEYY